MQLKRDKKIAGGFTLLEMVIVIVLISVLGLIILSRVWQYRVYAEEAMVTATVGNIRSALGLEVARLAVKEQTRQIARLENTNPMKLLAQTPETYLGETSKPETIKQKGVWYFNNNDKSLNYIVSYTEHFESKIKGVKRTRHQLKMVFTDNNQNGRFDKGVDYINGLDLVAMEPYKWVVEK
ncbi:MAG: type II secretion system protein [Thioalkalispiraceae bacterium]|jgi:prepilin-type N-terminal cleavage/methylation domain-containing protein